MKLLIVDDEELIRLKLKHIVEQSSLKFHAVETASNVFEALDSIAREVPAVILSDIRMPQKSGLEIAKYVCEQNLPSRVILITGFSDFEYAKAGIAYHVFDYILKPIDEIATCDVIRMALRAFQEEQKQQKLYQSFQNYYTSHQEEIRRQTIQQLLSRPHSVDIEKQMKDTNLLSFSFRHYELIGCRHQSKAKSRSLKTDLFISYALENSFSDIFGKDALLYSHGDTLFGIVSLENQKDRIDALHDQLEACMEYFTKQYHQNMKLGISRTADSLEELDELREQVSICLSHEQIYSNSVIYYEELPLTYNKLLTVNSSISNLIALLQAKNKTAFREAACSFLIFIKKYNAGFRRQAIHLLLCNVSFYLNNLNIDSAQLRSANDSIDGNLQNLDSFCMDETAVLDWLCRIYDILSVSENPQGSMLIEQVKSYIYQNFDKPIGLAEVADYLHRNPSYISRLIKRETGQNLTQMLTEFRISNAKSLLKNTNMKISDVAWKTGYPNQQYFNRIFTEQVGMSPSDYRKISRAFP